MIKPEYPDYVDAGLKDIDESFHLRWNPRARVIKFGSYDSEGNPLPPEYEPRWEVWGKDVEGQEYKVFLVDVNGNFREPGQWLLDRLNQMNPARFGGNVSRMLREVVDQPNNLLQEVAERDWTEFVRGITDWYWNIGQTMVTKTKDGI